MKPIKKQIALIGWPIAHSLSPAMHNAALTEVGLDWTYTLFPTQEGELESTLRKLSDHNVVGGNVTMPHKQAIIPYLSGMSDEARIMGAVNTFRVQNGGLFGYNTDAAGFISPLELAGHNIVNMRIVIIGAGGAARSAIFSLAQSGASEILVINRTVTRGVQLTREMQTAFSGCRLEFRPLSLKTLTGVSEEQVDILVNATSVGMEPNHADSLWPAYLPLPRRALCYDVIYKPLKTLFLQQAEATGHPILNGLEMLVHQGAVGFEIWTGHKVSVDTLTKACLKALDGRAH